MKLFAEKFCSNKEVVKKLCDKRQDKLTINRRIDTRVTCPAEMYVYLHFLFDRRSWVVTKFVDSHSHELSSPDKVHHYCSYQTHQSKISKSIMRNLVDVGIGPSNISRVVNVMNHEEGCEEVSPQQVIDFTRHHRSNIGHEFNLIINYFQEKAEFIPDFFSLQVKLIM